MGGGAGGSWLQLQWKYVETDQQSNTPLCVWSMSLWRERERERERESADVCVILDCRCECMENVWKRCVCVCVCVCVSVCLCVCVWRHCKAEKSPFSLMDLCITIGQV